MNIERIEVSISHMLDLRYIEEHGEPTFYLDRAFNTSIIFSTEEADALIEALTKILMILPKKEIKK